MTETPAFGDPTTAPFWAAAAERRLIVQRCAACGHHQFYPRPFCLACTSRELAWVEASGNATVHSQTRNRLTVLPWLEPPYLVALVDLDEGPRLLTNIVGEPTAIGDRVVVTWRERSDGPPLPVFRKQTAGT